MKSKENGQRVKSGGGNNVDCLEQSLGFTHGRLDVERPDVLPLFHVSGDSSIREKLTYLLLEERDQEVDGQHGVLHDVVFGHVNVTDSDTEAEDLLQLELDGGLDFGDLSGEILRVRDGSGELSGLGETRTQESICQSMSRAVS